MSPVPEVEVALDAARRLLRGSPYGFLTTVRGAEPHARLVQHLAVDDDLTLWIGTSPRSRKVADLAVAPRVAYAVEERSRFAYVTVRASADIVDDAAERAAKWEDGLAAFFPAGPGGDDFVLVRLRPDRVELMDFTAGLHPDPYGLVPVVLDRRPAAGPASAAAGPAAAGPVGPTAASSAGPAGRDGDWVESAAERRP